MENIVNHYSTDEESRSCKDFVSGCGLFKKKVPRFQKMKIIWKQEIKVVYPLDILDSLNAFLPQYLNLSLEITGSQIELLNIFDDKRGFIASCYAVLIDGYYYGAVAGSKNLFVCSKNAYHFIAGEQVNVVIAKNEDCLFELVGKYDKESLSICFSHIQRRNLTTRNCCENLIIFIKPVSFIDAVYAAEKYMQKL